MDARTKWHLLRYGDEGLGLELLQRSYDENPSPSTIMELSVGYLWTEKYQTAWEHMEHAIQIHPFTIESFLGTAGVAKWCLDEPDGAVQSWRSGLDVQFADPAGGVSCPLLLWITSVLKPEFQSNREAVLVLEKTVTNVRIKNWPGALAQFVLGLIDDKTLEERSLERISQTTSPANRWRTAFYRYALDFDRGNMTREKFRELMRGLTDTSIAEWSEEKDFLRLIWNVEFYIARYEASLRSDACGVP